MPLRAILPLSYSLLPRIHSILLEANRQPARVELKKLILALCMPVSNYGTLKADETPANECAHITPVAGKKALSGEVSI